MQHSVPKYKRLVVYCRFVSRAHQSFQGLLWASTNASPWTHWERELVYSTLRPSAELGTLSLRSSPIVCNSKNVWHPNTCYFDHSRRKKESSSKNILSRLRASKQTLRLLIFPDKIASMRQMFKNTKWRDLIPILWILFYSSEINKKKATHHQVIGLLLWKQRTIFFMVSEGGHLQKEMSRKLHKISRLKYISFCWKIKIGIYITWTKYMRRTFKCTGTDIDLHQKDLHSPNP